ncbi:class I SAM-dependent methyltransferase [Candidatus Roizmanbacteria bacterium]|nr:class I SAM-dependent methyltransferase [Candidatus Roizmanbacteria bacterium]
MNHYYRSEFEYPAGKNEEDRIRKRAKTIIACLKKLNSNGQKLLDVGSGYGYFLDEALKQKLNITGIEPSKNLHSPSIDPQIKECIIHCSFEDYFKKKSYQKFDFISLIHVIEHVSYPKQFIQMCSKLLNKNGILYIETPNFNSWLAKKEKMNYTFLTPPDHIWLFSSKSLRLIIEKFKQLYIESISTYSYPEHLMGMLKNELKPESEKLKVTNENLKLNINLKRIKYVFFDKLFAPLFTPLLNIGIYGSILELYIKKN